jgi:hypothetical protein
LPPARARSQAFACPRQFRVPTHITLIDCFFWEGKGRLNCEIQKFFTPIQQKKEAASAASVFLSDLLIFFSFYLVHQRLESAVKRLFERFGGTFNEKVVSGNVDPDLRDLVLDVVNDIVQLEKNIYLDNSVMERV